jgi:hypothetical protein
MLNATTTQASPTDSAKLSKTPKPPATPEASLKSTQEKAKIDALKVKAKKELMTMAFTDQQIEKAFETAK